MELFLPYPSNLVTTDQTGQFASNAALIASGALLYSWIVVGSGAGGGGISAAELAATGAKITSLSGFVGNISGYLDNRFSLTGSNLDSKINSLSGYSNATFATIINLGTTGSNLFNLIVGLSGDDASKYATLINLTATGVNLQAQINTLNSGGYISTGLADLRFVHLTGNETISGVKTFRGPINVETFAGDGLVININGISGTYAGTSGAGNEVDVFHGNLKVVPNVITVDWANRVLSGEWLTNAAGVNPLNIVNFQKLVDTSGALVSQISASSAGVAQLNGKSGIVTLIGTGGITITAAGQQIIISGGASGAGGGGVSQAQLDSLSGYSTTHFLDKIVVTDQSVASTVGFSNLITNSGGYLNPDGMIGEFLTPDTINSVPFTGHLEIDGSFFNIFCKSGTKLFSIQGWDFTNQTIYLGSSSDGIVIDLGNQFLSGNWRTSDTGTDPFNLVTLNRLNSASGLLQSKIGVTGSNLYVLLTGASGQFSTNFATILNLTQTGVILGAKIDSLSGFAGNASGALQTLLINNSTNLSGNLTSSGILLSAVKVTGSNIINVANFTGLGGTLVIYSGNSIYISGAAAGGGGGVTSLNGLTNAVTILGTGTISGTSIGNQIYVSGGGTKTIKTWNALENESPASNYATFNTRNSHPLLSFDEVVQQAAVFRARVPESTNFFNGLIVSTQWVAEASVTGTLVSGTIGWDAAIERIVSGGQSLDVDGFGTAKTIIALSGYQNGITRITSVNFSTGDLPLGFGAGDMFRLRIRRDVANDNSTGNAQLLQVDLTLL